MIRKIKGYKKLNRKELKQIFRKNISDFVFNYDEYPSEEERLSAMIAEDEMNIKLKHFPRVSYPVKINTPDFATVSDCVVLEVKSTGSIKNGFNNAYKQAKKQFSELRSKYRKIVFVNADRLPEDVNDNEIIEMAVSRAFAHNIEYYVIVRLDKILCEKLP